ncbi:MAG: pentapeptide repeat-containing protein, partial [Actinomycetales bacterium]
MARSTRCLVVAVVSLFMVVSAQGQSWAAEVINGCAIVVNARCPGADLSASNLADANLSGADLEAANFEAADLTRATLVNANLNKAWL